MKYTFVLIGPPACGKGTLARLLSKRFNIPAISTGDLIRDEIEHGDGSIITPLDQAKMLQGEMLADAKIFRLIKRRLEKLDCVGGFVLDGVPRNNPQAEFIRNLLEDPCVVWFDGDRETYKKRLLARGRKDDTPESAEKRFAEFDAHTLPLMEYYLDQAAAEECTLIGVGTEAVENMDIVLDVLGVADKPVQQMKCKM